MKFEVENLWLGDLRWDLNHRKHSLLYFCSLPQSKKKVNLESWGIQRLSICLPKEKISAILLLQIYLGLTFLCLDLKNKFLNFHVFSRLFWKARENHQEWKRFSFFLHFFGNANFLVSSFLSIPMRFLSPNFLLFNEETQLLSSQLTKKSPTWVTKKSPTWVFFGHFLSGQKCVYSL